MATEEKDIKDENIATEEPQTEAQETQEEGADMKVEKEEEAEPAPEPTPEEQIAEAKDKYLRLYSEFENFRRRTSKEKLELISSANKGLMEDLVPVLDDFERAMQAAGKAEDVESIKEGMSLIQNKFSKVLENKGLKKIEIKKGDDFNDEFQEAITQIPTEKELEGKVVDVVEPGYKLGDAIVRFAKVVVGAKQ